MDVIVKSRHQAVRERHTCDVVVNIEEQQHTK